MKRFWTLVFSLLFPATGWAVPSIVQCLHIQGGTVTGMTSSSASFTGNNCQLGNAQTLGNCVTPTPGNLMVVPVNFEPLGGPQVLSTPTDNQGTPYVQDITHARLDNNIRAYLFSGTIPANVSGTFTVTLPFTALGNSLVVIGWTACEVAGLPAGPALDQVGGGDNQGAMTLTVTAQGANTAASTIVFTVFNSTPTSAPPGFTTIASDNVTYYTYIGYRITSAIETSSMTATFASISSATGVLASYRANGTNPAPTGDSITVSINDGPCTLGGPLTTTVGVPFTGLNVTTNAPPATCTLKVHNNTTAMPDIISNPFIVTAPVPFLSFSQQPSDTVTGNPFTPAIAGTKVTVVQANARLIPLGDSVGPVEFNRIHPRVSPTTYPATTATDFRAQPTTPPTLGVANTVITDPLFGTEILRVTDTNTNAGQSFISTDAGFFRTFNANNTAIKLTGPHGDGWWLEFNPATFRVGDGSSNPRPHSVPYGANWSWSVTNPDIIYTIRGNQISAYNKSTGVTTDVGGPPNGAATAYMALPVGEDNWVCSAAGPGQQDTWNQIFCIQPANPASYKFIDLNAKTINGVAQSDPNWPNYGVGIHGMTGGTGNHHLGVTFHQQNWGGNGDSAFNLNTNTWSLVKGPPTGDIFWGGHTSMGNGYFTNGAGSGTVGNDSRGNLVRNPDDMMNTNYYRFVGQASAPYNGWCDAEHSSWHNSVTNPNAPIFSSRYIPGCAFTWSDEILAMAVDGSNTVYRFAHNYNSACYYAQAFAQISNDGQFLLFSSMWGGTTGVNTAFGCPYRLDTFMLRLNGTVAPGANPVLAWTQHPTNTISGSAISPTMAGTLLPAAAHSLTLSVQSGGCTLGGTLVVNANGSTGAWSFPGVTVSAASPPQNCILQVTDTTNNAVLALVSNGFNVTATAAETVTVSVDQGNCQLGGTTMVTMNANAWSFPGLTVTSATPPEICRLRVHDSDSASADAVSNTFTVTANLTPTPVMAFTAQPSDTVSGNAFNPTVAGTLTPAVAHTLVAMVYSGGCGLSGDHTVVSSASSGAWSFPDLRIAATTPPQNCTLLIRDTSALAPALDIVSTPFSVSANVPSGITLTWISQPTTTASGTVMTPAPVLKVSPVPALGQPGIPVTLAVTAGDCTFTGAMTQTSAAADAVDPGAVVFNLTANAQGTTCVFTATAPGATPVMSSPFTITPPPTIRPPLTLYPVPLKP